MLHSGLSNFHYPLAFLLVGLLLLLFGRRLFWLFVAVAGFIVGAGAAHYILPHQSEVFTLLVGAVLGILGAVLAIFVQKIAIALGGFLVGGYLAVVIGSPILGGVGVTYPGAWLFFLIGGVVGALLMIGFFNWALIILSSLQGAHLILQGLPPIRGFAVARHFPILFIILAVIGIVVQASTYRRRPAPAE